MTDPNIITIKSAALTADQLVQREVHQCLSSLVSTLAKGLEAARFANGPSPGGCAVISLAEQATELCYPLEDHEEAARQAGWERGGDCGGFIFHKPTWGSWKAAASWSGDGDEHDSPIYDTWEECCEAQSIEPYQWEILEHWAVSSWLAGKLQERGERVDLDFAGMCVWGRTTTGQGIASDSVIRSIYEELVSA